MCLCVSILQRSLHFSVRVFFFLSHFLYTYNYSTLSIMSMEINNSRHNILLRARACWWTTGLTSTCLQTEWIIILSVYRCTFESPSYCWFSILQLLLQIRSYPNFSQCWVGNNPIRWLKIPPLPGMEPVVPY